MRRRKNVKGFIYLLHFSEPYKHARHYTGWAVAEHIEGGAKCNPLVKAASAAGIRIEVARIYEGKTRIETAQGYVVPWLASQTDLLSEDWIEVA